MSRYSDMEFYSNLSAERGVKLLVKSIEKTREKHARQLYAQLYGTMTPESFITFEKFYEPAGKQVSQNKKTKEEVMRDVESIISGVSQ